MLPTSRAVLTATFVILSGSGCSLNFGETVHVTGAKFTAQHLASATQITGIQFPDGSQGVGYFYQGDALDPFAHFKIIIPAGKKDEFQGNSLFQKWAHHESVGTGDNQISRWWTPGLLTERTDISTDPLANPSCKVSIGKEKNDWVVYVSWSTR